MGREQVSSQVADGGRRRGGSTLVALSFARSPRPALFSLRPGAARVARLRRRPRQLAVRRVDAESPRPTSTSSRSPGPIPPD